MLYIRICCTYVFIIYIFMYVCMYVYMYVRMYICVYMYVCTYVCMYVCMYICKYICTYVLYVCMYIRMCVHVCCHRDVKDTDIQTLERRLMQTMDMIISKKKRSVLSSPCPYNYICEYLNYNMQVCHRLWLLSTHSLIGL